MRKNSRGTHVLMDLDGELLSHDVPTSHMKEISYSGEETFDIEEVLKDRINKNTGKQEYYVKWMGFEDPTWEPADNFMDYEVIKQYWLGKTPESTHN